MGDTAAHLGPGALVGGRFLLGARLPARPGSPAYLARDTAPDGPGAGAPLAVRLVADGGPRFVERAARAVDVSRRSPVAVAVLAAGVHERRGFLVTRHVEAPDALARVRDGGLLAPAHAVAVAVALAGALDLAHADGFVHHGVGPPEVLLPGGGARLAGFGAHAGPPTPPSRLAAAPWTAPEALARGPADHRADVFGLAAVLGHLALGHLPGEPRRARPELAPVLEDGLWALLERALHPDPARRPASAGQLAAQARAVLEREAAGAGRRRRARRRTTVAVGALASVAALAAPGGAGEPRGAVDAAREQRAERTFTAELAPLLQDAQRAARTFGLDVLQASARRPAELPPPALLLARADRVEARRTRALRRIARLEAPTSAARQARELALTVLEGRLDHQRVLAGELRRIPAGLRGSDLAARYAAARVPTRQLARFVGVTSRTALTDAWNALLRRAGRPRADTLDL